MTLQRKLFRIGAVALLLATLAAAFLTYSWSRNKAIEALQAGAEERVEQIALRVFAPTAKYAHLPNVISRYSSVRQALQHPRDASRILDANVLLNRLSRDTGAAAIYVMNANGLTIAASNWQEETSFVGNNYAFRPYFLDAIRNGHGSFYGIGVTTDVAGHYLSHAVNDGGKVLGVVVVKVDINHVADFDEAPGDEVIVTDENGVIFLSSREEWKYRPVWPLTDSTQERLRATRQYETVLKSPWSIDVDQRLTTDARLISVAQKNGEETEWVDYFAKRGKLPGSDWQISVLTPMKTIDVEARQMALLSIGLIALLVLLSMYRMQVYYRNRERRESRRELEEALQALEKEHVALQAVSEELRHASITDPLTGAYNRRFFLEAVVKLVSAANRHEQPLSIIMVDVDNFKRINDEYGHPAGDQALKMLASVYRKELRDEDIFARFGGEEFIMALPNTDEATAALVAERLREKVMDQPVTVDGESITVTVSSGISQHRQNEKTIQPATKRADDALYEAKNNGRNCVMVQ